LVGRPTADQFAYGTEGTGVGVLDVLNPAVPLADRRRAQEAERQRAVTQYRDPHPVKRDETEGTIFDPRFEKFNRTMEAIYRTEGDAQNKRTTARGPGQMLESTFQDETLRAIRAGKQVPGVDLTPQQLEAVKRNIDITKIPGLKDNLRKAFKDPKRQAEAARVLMPNYTERHINQLEQGGIDPTQANLYMANVLGVSGVERFKDLVKTAPHQRFERSFPAPAQANGWVGKTNAQVHDILKNAIATRGGVDPNERVPLPPKAIRQTEDQLVELERQMRDPEWLMNRPERPKY
jgi:hypothetical protein